MDTAFEKDPFAVLGLEVGATEAEIKTAYRRRAREEHPDLFPPAERRSQQLRMMEVNEAYMRLVARDDADAKTTRGDPGTPTESPHAREPFAGLKPRSGIHHFKKSDPAYALHRQGFDYLGRARALMNPRRNLDDDEIRELNFRSGMEALRLSRLAYRCFLNVVSGYPDSIWVADALEQMEQIEGMSRVYQRMCENSLRTEEA